MPPKPPPANTGPVLSRTSFSIKVSNSRELTKLKTSKIPSLNNTRYINSNKALDAKGTTIIEEDI